MAGLHSLDLLTTLSVLARGGTEQNPVGQLALGLGSWGLLLGKILLVAVLIGCWHGAKHLPNGRTSMALGLFMSSGIMFAVVAWNTAMFLKVVIY